MSELVKRIRSEAELKSPSLLTLLLDDAADLIEALEASLEDTKGEDGFSLMRRIEVLEAALREIAELYRDPAGQGAEIARRALSETFVEETQVEGKP